MAKVARGRRVLRRYLVFAGRVGDMRPLPGSHESKPSAVRRASKMLGRVLDREFGSIECVSVVDRVGWKTVEALERD